MREPELSVRSGLLIQPEKLDTNKQRDARRNILAYIACNSRYTHSCHGNKVI